MQGLSAAEANQMLDDGQRVSRRQCPQCGWDAAGRPIEDAAGRPIEGAADRPLFNAKRVKRVAPTRCDYACGNCGYEWVE